MHFFCSFSFRGYCFVILDAILDSRVMFEAILDSRAMFIVN
jgi:hypothetical protein